jgi:hypothetical protein
VPRGQNTTRLSNLCSVERYLSLEQAKDRDAIVAVIVDRFEQRYLDPVSRDCTKKHGFTMMAVSCLMIEALESFWEGWSDSSGRSEAAFRGFFSRWPLFQDFTSVSGAFYKHVRCGILHQAETTGGWRVVRAGPLLRERTVNAAKFLAALRATLHVYANSLRTEEWESDRWSAARKKMAAICRNTQA